MPSPAAWAQSYRGHPEREGHLITDGSRFQGNGPPIVPGPFFAIRKHASAVFPLQSYVDKAR